MENTRKDQDVPVFETPEIVELDERLDMAFDPLGMLVEFRPKEPPNTNCLNSQCCTPPR
jgi:hypothetical protein